MFSTEGAEAKHKLTKLFAAAYSRLVFTFQLRKAQMDIPGKLTISLRCLTAFLEIGALPVQWFVTGD